METNSVAMLKIQRDLVGVILTVDKIDGVPLNKGRRFTGNNTREIELLPGRHDFMVSYLASGGGHSLADASIGFVAEAGKIYEMRAAQEDRSFGKELSLDCLGGHYIWTLWVLDAETQKVIAGKPRETPFHWYEY
jgi:hypothetical protein